MTLKLFYACLMVSFFTTMPVLAQDHQGLSAADIIAKMQSKLNLTSDQVTAITPIITENISKIDALKQQVDDGTLDRSGMRAQMKDLRATQKQELGQILSADQLSQWEQMQKSGHKRSSGNNGGGSWGHGDGASNNGSSGDGSSGSGE